MPAELLKNGTDKVMRMLTLWLFERYANDDEMKISQRIEMKTALL